MTRLKRILARLGLLAAALVMCLLLVEVALRLLGVYYPRTTEADPVLGVLHRPNMKFWFRDEGESFVEYNSAGFRDVEWTVEKAPDEFRIAVLGDSFVEALQVPAEQRFTELMAQDLATRPVFAGKKLRVMNFGMSGYGTAQELLVLRDRVAKYQPDLVVLAFLTGNDLSDNAKVLRPHSHRPFYTLDAGGQLQLDDSYLAWVRSEARPKQVAIYTLADWSRIVQLLYRVRKNLQNRAEVARVQARSADGQQEAGLDIQVYQEPTTDAWREAWDITEHLLSAVDEETKKLGGRLLVVTLSNGDQVHPDPQERARTMAKLGIDDLFYPDRRVAEFCTAHQIPVLTLAPALLEYADKNQAYLHGFPNTSMGGGHWNDTGHREAAKLIAGKIVELETSATANAAASAP